ncbi:MAG: glycosyltransferase involved in cell wall biosynthesis [Bacteroidia bacterium]|jgi:glycosyltransferase involved in cell wall biosynthesis
MSEGLKILQVSNRVPFPLNEGGTIGIFNYTRGFSEAGCDVTLFALAAKKHTIDHEEANSALSQYADYHVFNIDTDVKVLPAFFNLFSNKSYNVERFYDANFERALTNHLKGHDFDIIQIEGTFPARYADCIFQNRKQAKVVLRQHNVEFQIWERLAKNSTNLLKKWYLNLLSRRLKQFESQHLNQYDALIPVTDDDGDLFKQMGCTTPVFPSPAGIDTDLWSTSNAEDKQSIYHIGSLEWMPNVEAVQWFLDTIWPSLNTAFPNLHFYIAGKGMSDDFKSQRYKNVYMIGEVDSATEFIHDKGITVVPLKSGSGIRLKILEAMSAGKLVISSTIGAQGINYTDGENLILADTADAYVAAFTRVINDDVLYRTIKENARQLIKDKYSNESVIAHLLAFYKTL